MNEITGVSKDRGVYAVTTVIRVTANNSYHAEQLVKNLQYDESVISCKKIKSLTKKKDYPYYCSSCKDSFMQYLKKHYSVSPTNKGRCHICKESAWKLR